MIGDPAQLPLAVSVPALVALACAAFFFSGSETAFFSLQKAERQALEGDGITGARILRLLDRRTALVSTILLGHATVTVALATLAVAVLAQVRPGQPWLGVAVIVPLLVLVSEIPSRLLAWRYNLAWTRLAVWPMWAFFWLVSPIRWACIEGVVRLARLFGVTDSNPHAAAEAEIRNLLQKGTGVDEREREIIEAVFDFDENNVGRLMTPRPDIFAVPLDLPWEELMRRCREENNSRIPVYDGRLDNIVGVLLMKDLLRYRKRPPAGPRQLRSILWPPTFVPQSRPADDMLREFMERRFHMAFVVDEHGTLVGLITLDDLLSKLVGELLDPEDDEGEPDLDRPEPGVLTVKAYMDVEDFDAETGIALPPGEYTTVGGFVFHQLGRLPRRGDVVELDGHRFTVAALEGRRITEVRVDVAELPDGEAEAI